MVLTVEPGVPLLVAPGVPLTTSGGVFLDRFQRSAGSSAVIPVGNGWTDFAEAQPDRYDPVGLLDGKVVTRMLSRSTYAAAPYSPDPDGVGDDFLNHPGTILPGIGGAYRDFGTPHVTATVTWDGNWNPGNHTEATPLLCVNPDSDEYGFGAWPSGDGTHVFLIGSVGNPPELFGDFVVDAAMFDHDDGDDHLIELRANAGGTACTLWFDGVQVSTGNNGLGPIPIPAALQGSTLHGFEIDQHMVAYGADGLPSLANMQASPGLNDVRIARS